MLADELEENETFTPWHNIWLWACVALITPRNLNIVSNFINHKIWACVIIDAIFSDYKLVFSKSPKSFNITISFLVSHTIWATRRKDLLAQRRGLSPELDQEASYHNQN